MSLEGTRHMWVQAWLLGRGLFHSQQSCQCAKRAPWMPNWHTEQDLWSLVLDFWSSHKAYRISFPNQGSNLHPLHWKHSLKHWTTRKSPEPLFSLVMTSSAIILGTTKRAESVGGAWLTCSLSVYRFFASDLLAGWPFRWTCPGPGHTVDTAVKSGSGSAGLSAVQSSWWPTRTFQVQVIFNFLSQQKKKVQINIFPTWCYTARKISLKTAFPNICANDLVCCANSRKKKELEKKLM